MSTPQTPPQTPPQEYHKDHPNAPLNMKMRKPIITTDYTPACKKKLSFPKEELSDDEN